MRIFLAVCMSYLIYIDSFATATNNTGAAPPEKAFFAGGYFWCLEADLDKIPGVISTVSGYTGGNVNHPMYDQVSGGGTGHYESVEVTYNPVQVSYKELLMAFMHKIDPTDAVVISKLIKSGVLEILKMVHLSPFFRSIYTTA